MLNTYVKYMTYDLITWFLLKTDKCIMDTDLFLGKIYYLGYMQNIPG